MKAWFLFPLLFLTVLILGGAHPRSELRRLRRELETRKQAEAAPTPGKQRLRDFLALLPLETPPPPRAPTTATAEPAVAAPETTSTPDAAPDPAGPAPEPEAAPTAETDEQVAAFKTRLEQAAEAWRLRTELARAGFASKTGFSEREMAAFDGVMDAMNLRILTLFRQTADQVVAGESFSAESGIRLMNDLTSALVFTYDEMDRVLPATWRPDAADSFDLVTYVDPSVAAPLLEVQDKMPAWRRPGGPGWIGRPPRSRPAEPPPAP